MKKLLLLILICFVQNTFSQSTKKDSKTKASQTKSSEIPIVKIKSGSHSDSDLVVDEPEPSQAVITDNDNAVYNTAGIEVKPDFPGGMEKFFKFVDNNFKYPQDAEIANINLNGKKSLRNICS